MVRVEQVKLSYHLSNKYSFETGKDVRAIGAYPDSHLSEALGLEIEKTVGDIREELKQDTAAGEIRVGMINGIFWTTRLWNPW